VLKESFTLHYDMAYKSIQPRCDIHVYDVAYTEHLPKEFLPVFSPTQVVVIAQPLDGYEGVSVTNGSEHIATELAALGYLPFETIYVELYPREPGMSDQEAEELHRPSYSLIRYEWDGNVKARRPQWRSLSREDFEELVV
jgi:hypothetical protein